jgi:hybrid cluster-associated redox disulfide protein
MDSPITMEMTILEVLTAHPRAASVFLSLKTDCVGCPMERFCTLADVVKAYDVPIKMLLDALHESIHIPYQE